MESSALEKRSYVAQFRLIKERLERLRSQFERELHLYDFLAHKNLELVYQQNYRKRYTAYLKRLSETIVNFQKGGKFVFSSISLEQAIEALEAFEKRLNEVKAERLATNKRISYLFSLGVVVLAILLVFLVIRPLFLRLERRSSELMLANQKIEGMNEKLWKANLTQARFIANVGHDLKTPVSTILSSIRLVRKQQQFNHNSLELFNLIENEAYRLLVLIDNILEVSRGNWIRQKQRVYPVQLEDFIHRLCEKLREVTQRSGKELRVSIEENLPSVIYTDRSLLSRALENIFTCILQHAMKNVTLRVKVEKDFLIFHISAVLSSWCYRVFIQVKDPVSYFNTEPDSSMAIYGLSLAVAKQHLEFLGGGIDIFLEEEQSSIICVKVPLRIQKEKHLFIPQKDILFS